MRFAARRERVLYIGILIICEIRAAIRLEPSTPDIKTAAVSIIGTSA
jgi:hypothetical protein